MMRKTGGGSNKAFLLIIWLVSALFAADIRTARAERLPLKIFTSAEGLASGAILHIARDSRGFLWFSTRGGLSRFDGREFVTFRIGDQPETAAIVNSTYETRDGSFWISGDGGTFRALKESVDAPPVEGAPAKTAGFQIFKAQKIGEESFSAMFEDSRGRLWGGNGDVYLIAEGGELRMQKFDAGAIAQIDRGFGIKSFAETPDGSLWMGCDTGVLRVLPDNRRILYPIEKKTSYDGTGGVVADQNGRIWVAHTTGAYVFKAESLVALADTPDQQIRDLKKAEKIVLPSDAAPLAVEPGTMLHLLLNENGEESGGESGMPQQTRTAGRVFKSFDNKIWVPAARGMFAFDDEKTSYLSDTNGFPGALTTIAEDAENNIWFGTEAGALRYNRRGITSWGLTEGLFAPRLHSLYQTRDGSIYAVHGDWLVSRIADDGKIETGQLKLPKGDRFLWTSSAGLLDSVGGWWALSSNGLYRFAAVEKPSDLNARAPLETLGEKDGFKSNQFFSAFEDSGGNLWFANRDVGDKSGISRRDAKSGEWKFFNAGDGVPEGFGARSYAEDRTGNIWFGGYGGGLVRYANGRFTDFSKADRLPRGGIFALYTDGKNRLWIGSTRDGLAMVENPNAETLTFKTYTTAEGLASNNIRSLTGDFKGNIYAGTISGVDRLQPESGAVRHYSTADGLASDQISTALCDHKGRIWLGSLNGLSRLDPEADAIKPNEDLRVFIDGLQVAGKDYSVSPFGSEKIENIGLSSAENNLRIQFLSIGNELRYQYKLDGDGGKNWSDPNFERTVNFAGLAPGEYRFLVRAVDANGQASPSPASISFRIAPPFWRTWQFVGALFLTGVIGVLLLDRYRVKKTREVQKALDKSQESERVARESENRFRTLAQTASDAIITIDTASRIVFVNEAVEKVFGHPAETLLGENLTLLMPDDFHNRHQNGLDHYVATGAKNIPWNGIEVVGTHRSGALIPIEVSFGEFELDGKRYFTGIARDISERKRAEQALERAREERLAELEKVRTRIATDLHDDIGSSLTQIAVLTEVARASAVRDEVKTPLTRISDVSSELVDAMKDIVWAINPKKDSMRELILRMRRFASDVFSAREIEFEFDTPEEMENFSLGANIRREVFAIFKESVNNIVRHAGATEVQIDFAASEYVLRLEIKDNGRGFDTGAVLSEDFKPEMGGNGLVNMRRRAAELGGACEIESGTRGTRTTLEIPLHPVETDGDIHLTHSPIHTDGDGAGDNHLH